MLSSPFMLQSMVTRLFSCLYHFLSVKVCSLCQLVLYMRWQCAYRTQKAGVFGEMAAFSELNYLINLFITRLKKPYHLFSGQNPACVLSNDY